MFDDATVEHDGSLVAGRPEALSYYYTGGGIADGIEAVRQVRGGRLGAVAAIGLGTGSLACQTRPGENWAFFEIDPEVARMASDPVRFGFLAAYHALVEPLPREDRDRFYAEAAPAARLYGALGAPSSEAAWEAQLAAMLPRLERSDIVLEFLDLMRAVKVAGPLSRLQHPLIRAAVGLVPAAVRDVLGLGPEWLPRPLELPAIRAAARIADRMAIPGAPPYQACERMGLPGAWLYRPAPRAPT